MERPQPVRLAAMNPSGADVSRACSQASHSCTAWNRAASSGWLRGSRCGLLLAWSCAVAMQCSHTAGPCTITLARAPAGEFTQVSLVIDLPDSVCSAPRDLRLARHRGQTSVRGQHIGLHPEMANHPWCVSSRLQKPGFQLWTGAWRQSMQHFAGARGWTRAVDAAVKNL